MTDKMLFSLERVKALKAYFITCRAGLKGKPEWNDYDTAAKLCDQLVALIGESETPTGSNPGRKKAEGSASNVSGKIA
jgi:hypothetical protein